MEVTIASVDVRRRRLVRHEPDRAIVTARGLKPVGDERLQTIGENGAEVALQDGQVIGHARHTIHCRRLDFATA